MDNNIDQIYRQDHFIQLAKHKKQQLIYGTSGFRSHADLLPFVSWRLGLYMGINANETQIYGVMITASHNMICDNGFKIVPPFGGMLTQQQEADVQAFYQQEQIEIKQNKGCVWIGRDTRPSSQQLAEKLIEGVKTCGCLVRDLGIVTTPQFSYLVYCQNRGKQNIDQFLYVNDFCTFFKSLVKQPIKGKLIVDCAEGVGGVWMKEFKKQLHPILDIETLNDGQQPNLLNDCCGSEYVQKQKKIPKDFIFQENNRYAALDGDADRLIYFKVDKTDVHIIEGDRFAILFAQYISMHIKKGTIGVIQTAYANAASTKYLTHKLKLQTRYEPTGVKHLHRAAHEYDIGIYFEANGHGAILINREVEGDEELMEFLKLSNQAIGDAITNLLMSEYLLDKLKMTVDDWLNLYHDYPSLTTKLAVRNKQIIKTNYDETQLLEPIEIKNKVEDILKGYSEEYRVLIRPSGTEDVVRVLSEGPQETDVIKLNSEIIELLKQYMEID